MLLDLLDNRLLFRPLESPRARVFAKNDRIWCLSASCNHQTTGLKNRTRQPCCCRTTVLGSVFVEHGCLLAVIKGAGSKFIFCSEQIRSTPVGSTEQHKDKHIGFISVIRRCTGGSPSRPPGDDVTSLTHSLQPLTQF